ncbi:MAG: tRNA glutamyl-Q(34) synthetase GluQRS, partial [Planctomycetes bacterium]|nr:tRNA glutamyl-Q(34) synthetase GluQRS [Planctomycetota bacterium]
PATSASPATADSSQSQLHVRFAPSPTGYLHVGGARTALFNWLLARQQGGKFSLRIEDTDAERSTEEAVEQILDALRWLGLDWDGEPVLQSERLDRYRQAIDRLAAAGRVYPCICTRKEVDEAASAPHESIDDGPVYPGTCRGRFADVAEARAATGREPALRFRVDTDAVPFDDGCRGAQAGRIAGDFVVQKRDGGPAYQLAVVTDDAAQGVTEVVRGDDLLPSTPRQLLLYRALGLDEPRFHHVPLVVGGDGLRLAKRHGDTSLRWFRERGVSADAVVGHLAFLCGMRERGSRSMPRDLLPGFDLRRLPRDPVRGDEHGLVG